MEARDPFTSPPAIFAEEVSEEEKTGGHGRDESLAFSAAGSGRSKLLMSLFSSFGSKRGRGRGGTAMGEEES